MYGLLCLIRPSPFATFLTDEVEDTINFLIYNIICYNMIPFMEIWIYY